MMICFSMPDGLEDAWKTPYAAVQVTVRATAAHNTGTARTGDRPAAELPSARQTAQQVARRPLRRIGCSIHFQEAAARVIAVAASAAPSQGAPGRGPVIAAAIAMTGQCHR
jgi:starvation-inducible outer membrane lipoprotein